EALTVKVRSWQDLAGEHRQSLAKTSQAKTSQVNTARVLAGPPRWKPAGFLLKTSRVSPKSRSALVVGDGRELAGGELRLARRGGEGAGPELVVGVDAGV